MILGSHSAVIIFTSFLRKEMNERQKERKKERKGKRKERKTDRLWMNRNSCPIVQKLKKMLYKKIDLACYTPSIRIHNVWFSFFVHLLFTWNSAFACEWKKAKLYPKVHEKKLLIGSLIEQTPSEPLSSFIFSLNINWNTSVKIVFVV